MKIRKSFVSNSSSTSFIIDNLDKLENQDEVIHKIDTLCKKTYNNYTIYNNTLYTSFISDGYEEYNEFYTLPYTREYNGSHGYPYDENEFIEYKDVWIPLEDLSEEDYKELKLPSPSTLREVYYILEKYIKKEITAKELKEEVECYYECSR